MRAVEISINRSMQCILWFIVLSTLFYLLGLHYYFSSKGSLLSSAIAACFGAPFLNALRRPFRKSLTLTFTLPFIFVLAIYVFCPSRWGLLFALVLVGFCMGVWSEKHRSSGIVGGGRSELIMRLQSAGAPYLTEQFEVMFRLWSSLCLISVLVFAIFPSHWVAFIPLAAIAVRISSVLDLQTAQEHQ
jgi:uncharacterized membrane protein YoaK (UPF0700 family)